MNVLRNGPSAVAIRLCASFACRFVVCSRSACAGGAQIYLLNPPRKAPFSYGRCLGQLLRNQGPFDVIHSHVHLFTGSILRTAARCGVPKRIAHSHTNDDVLYARGTPWRRAYRYLMRGLIDRYATAGLACSAEAASRSTGTTGIPMIDGTYCPTDSICRGLLSCLLNPGYVHKSEFRKSES